MRPSDSAEPPARTISLVRSPAKDGVGVFRVDAGPRVDFYAMHEIRCDIGGRGFAVHKLGLGLLYHVRAGERKDCSCECLGFLRWGRCKHVSGLRALIERGQI